MPCLSLNDISMSLLWFKATNSSYFSAVLSTIPSKSIKSFLCCLVWDSVNTFSIPGVDTDELDSNVDDWEEETVEFFINEEIITLAEPE